MSENTSYCIMSAIAVSWSDFYYCSSIVVLEGKKGGSRKEWSGQSLGGLDGCAILPLNVVDWIVGMICE